MDQQTQASGILQTQQAADQQQKQFDANMAFQREQAAQAQANAVANRQAAAASPVSFGSSAPAAAPAGSSNLAFTPQKGFQFTDGSGRPISAASYASAKGIPYRDLLSQMAGQGDKNAALALNLVGNDYKADPNKLANGFDTSTMSYGGNNANVRSALRALGVINA
jgi:hypothetical protein